MKPPSGIRVAEVRQNIADTEDEVALAEIKSAKNPDRDSAARAHEQYNNQKINLADVNNQAHNTNVVKHDHNH